MILYNWKLRLAGCERKVYTWQDILRVRSLVLSPLENVDSWIKFSSLCRHNSRDDLSEKTMSLLMNVDVSVSTIDSNTLFYIDPKVAYGYIKHLYGSGNNLEAYELLKR